MFSLLISILSQTLQQSIFSKQLSSFAPWVWGFHKDLDAKWKRLDSSELERSMKDGPDRPLGAPESNFLPGNLEKEAFNGSQALSNNMIDVGSARVRGSDPGLASE